MMKAQRKKLFLVRRIVCPFTLLSAVLIASVASSGAVFVSVSSTINAWSLFVATAVAGLTAGYAAGEVRIHELQWLALVRADTINLS